MLQLSRGRAGFGHARRPPRAERWRSVFERLEGERASLDARLADLQEALVTGALPAGSARGGRATACPSTGWRLHRYSASRPVLLDAGDPAHRAAARACQQVRGAPPALLRSGGSIPIVELLARRCGVPTVLLGFALPGDNAHAPNERFHLPHLELGARTLELMLADLGEEARQRRRRSGTVRSARPAAASFSRGRASRRRRGQPP